MNFLNGIGKALKFAAPAVGFFNPAVGAGMGFAGGLADRKPSGQIAPGVGRQAPTAPAINVKPMQLPGIAAALQPRSGGGGYGRMAGQALTGIGRFLGGNQGANGLALAGIGAQFMGGRAQDRQEQQQLGYHRDDVKFQQGRQLESDAQRKQMLAAIMEAMAARRAG